MTGSAPDSSGSHILANVLVKRFPADSEISCNGSFFLSRLDPLPQLPGLFGIEGVFPSTVDAALLGECDALPLALPN